MTARDWDASTYDRVADPMARWGTAVLARLPLRPGDRVLDAGCGSGRVTEPLLERAEGVSVVALDGSPAMIEEARRRLGRFGGRVEYVVADLARPLPLARPVDAVFSTATFHWIADHDALFRHLAAVLVPGGRLVAQCGGAGNVASVARAVAEVGGAGPSPWTFATPEETRDRLERAGFVEVEAWLHEEPTPVVAGEPLETYLATVVLGAHLERLPPMERAAFVGAVAARLPSPVIDYVRLNIAARRGGASP